MSMEKVAPVASQAQGTHYTMADSSLQTDSTNLIVAHHAIERIGMGRYQWQLLVTCGFGFLVDQMLLVSISIITPNTAKEFGPAHATLLSASLYAGLLVGAILYGVAADYMGRKLVWQLSIYGVSVITMLSASATSWTAVNVWMTLNGLFAGGNLAIDLTILAEALPRKWTFLLTGLAAVWGLGNAITGLIAWPLVDSFCCPNGATPETCTRAENMGWRYLDIILGGLCLIMAIVRSLVLGMDESPKWLVTTGKLEEAVKVINAISAKNKSDYVVDIDMFSTTPVQNNSKNNWLYQLGTVKHLFFGLKQVRLIICLVLLWALVGIAYPLYTVFLSYYLEAHGANLGDGSNYQTYRDWAISSVVGIFGPVLSAYLVRVPFLGHRWSLTITGCICAVFAGAFTSVKTEGQNIGFSCMINFWLNALYAIIYAYTPTVFKTEHRAIACGLLLACGRLTSLSSPFIATYVDVTSPVPLWISCAFYVAIGIIALALPFEPSKLNDLSTEEQLG
ncbi:major facilitator superfamily domain-containing protein [Talaromyces proteolyticus]|uniref:Major facilitator superfamily domain-containing protein n=1 Tax=Talaromyces proteolyticus TaxID=1131652 RepID=A0AAD4Q1J8_9EURO|nr:major facilitator superfamily domain-containing protein [Talaromyces proteolyticus]KAH8702349.1 major facilitator superfamily domain-containing protein [Talaromyces proteolyticus]